MPEITDPIDSEQNLRALGVAFDNPDAEPAPPETSPPAEDAPSQISQTSPTSATPEAALSTPAAPTTDAALAELAHRHATAQQLAAHAQREAFQRQWWDTVRRELETTPELKDEKSEVGQALQAVLRETPLYSLTPDGFRHAAALARARHAAGNIPALQARLDALNKENERLVKLTSVTGSGPAKHPSANHSDYSERDLRRLAAELDNS